MLCGEILEVFEISSIAGTTLVDEQIYFATLAVRYPHWCYLEFAIELVGHF